VVELRPGHVRLLASSYEGLRGLNGIASASFKPRGAAYDPRVRLRRRAIALRGGPNSIVIAFAWATTEVRVRVLSNGSLSSDDVEHAIVLARGATAVDDDPTEFLAMVRGHPVLGPLALRTDVRLPRAPTIFESLAVAIIEQLVTGFEARASIRRLWRIAGEAVPGTGLAAAPMPAAVRRVPMWKLHEIGVGSRRAVTLHSVAGRGAAIERLREVSPPIAIEKLQTIHGVGPWTANAVARSAFGFSDAVPIGDFHSPFTISAALGGRDDLGRDDPAAADDAMLEVLEPFRPHRARVAVLLERPVPGERRIRLPRVDPHRREPWRY
jgi:3-methyladenine DNA glycosylase/8-oxoguanine DNA glycosylase